MRKKNERLTDEILAAHGARPDLILWRNATAKAWVGKYTGRTVMGEVTLLGGVMIHAGLCEGSSDLIGILKDRDGRGRFVALEVKMSNTRTTTEQERFLAAVRDMGGIAAVVRSLEEVTYHLGEPNG